MNSERLSELRGIAEKAKETKDGSSLAAHVDAMHAFRQHFDPTTCLALLEEVERLTGQAEKDKAAFDEMYGLWREAVTQPTIKQQVGKGLVDAFRGDPRYQKKDKQP